MNSRRMFLQCIVWFPVENMPNKNKALISLQLVCIFKPGISIERTHQSNQPVLNFSKRPVCLTVNYIMIEVLINISITEGGAVHFDSVYMERRRIRPLSPLFTSPSGNSCILFLLINFCFCCLTNFIYKTQGTSTLLSVTEKNSKLKVCSYWLKHSFPWWSISGAQVMINELNLDTILLSFDMLVFLVTSTDTIFLLARGRS